MPARVGAVVSRGGASCDMPQCRRSCGPEYEPGRILGLELVDEAAVAYNGLAESDVEVSCHFVH